MSDQTLSVKFDGEALGDDTMMESLGARHGHMFFLSFTKEVPLARMTKKILKDASL